MTHTKIAHIGHFFKSRMTGPKNSVTLLSGAINSLNGYKSDVFTISEKDPFPFNNVTIQPIADFDPNNYDVIVFPGIFNFSYFRIAKQLNEKNIPYIISPRSSLMKKALQKSLFKKVIALTFLGGYQFIKKACAIHYLTNEEKINSLKINRNDFVCTNGVDSDCFEHSAECPSSSEIRIIGYLGRYDIQHKGLDLFIKAVISKSAVLRKHRCKVQLHGNDFKGGKHYLEKLVKSNGIEDIMSVSGSLSGAEKYQFLSSCNIFVHTSRYEGQPQSVLEALSRGTPVLITPGTNLTHIVKENMLGWVCAPQIIEISKSLQEIATCNETIIDQMSHNSRVYSQQNLQWSKVAEKFCFIVESRIRQLNHNG